MTPNIRSRLLLAATAVVVVVGLADAAASGEWDLFGLLAIIVVLQGLIWLQLSWGRPAVPLRADLVSWLDDRAVAGGESVENVADRAIGAYRAGLTGVDPDT
ncbi:MAG: hypothetical protein ACR2QE_20925, partial [Acidimicrobiales bacterium]